MSATLETGSRPAPVVTIEGGRTTWRAELAAVLRARELLGFLVWRDIKVRYQQTIFGVGWAVLQPLLTMVVFALILGRLAGLQAHLSVSYAAFALAGLVPWTFAANGLTAGANSLVGSQHLITKVYFPRLLVPLAVVGAGLADLVVGLGLMFLLVPLLGVPPTWSWLALPFILALLVVAVGALACLLAGLTALYRDVRFVVPFLVQVGMFVTPVLWPLELVGPRWRWLVLLNPFAGCLEASRAAVLGTWDSQTTLGLVLASVTIAALVPLALMSFARVEERLADVI
ncbi:MAG TPA: ABC transporter permease [Gemmatales bacterium]|nr:ABC transporter permease [Gemmatales bacterium]HMP61407.1 ABC transporter permease [Gemmatales bacterium]